MRYSLYMNSSCSISDTGSRRPVLLFPLIFAVFLLNACANTGIRSANEEADLQANPSALTGDLLYDLLVGEFAGNSGDMALSVESYSRAAMKTQDARVAARATYIAVYSERYQDSLDLLDRWQRLDPEDADVSRMYAITYLKLGQPLEAATYIQGILDTVEGNGHEKAPARQGVKHRGWSGRAGSPEQG